MAALLSQLQSVLANWDAARITATAATPVPRADRHPVPSPNAITYGPVHGFHTPSHSASPSPTIIPIPVDFYTPVDDSPEHPEGRRYPFVHSHALEELQDPRQALNKLELARAALALFTSNAGVYRPLLQQVLRFLFEYIDFLVEDRGHLLYELANVNNTGGGARCGLGPDGSAEREHNDVVAAAYQKVRLVETRMASLAEEASAQRDRYKAQIATLQRTQAKLEALLRHQMELNHILVDYPMEGMDLRLGPAGAAAALSAATNAATGVHLPDPTLFDADGRDAAYVKRLIARAEKEKVLEDMERQLTEMQLEQGELNDKIASLLRLNSRYARQAVELSARLSIIHEHNIALATDVQLFQRDYVRETQRGEKLRRDVVVSKGMLLTLLEARSREIVLGTTRGNWDGIRHHSPKNKALQLTARESSTVGNGEVTEEGEDPKPLEAANSSANWSLESVPKKPVLLPASPLNEEDLKDRVEEALFVVQDKILRQKILEILAINDVSSGGTTKTALLTILNLKQQAQYGGGNGHNFDDATRHNASDRLARHKGTAMDGGAAHYRQHLWCSPMGCGPQVPRHLRSRWRIPLIPFDPHVAECFIHEMLTQRHELLDDAWREQEAAALVAGVCHPASSIVKDDLSTDRLMPLDEFIVLFINVVWLNSDERLSPLLPEPIREKFAEEREALRVESSGAPWCDVAHTQVTWQLHSLVHSIRPPEELLRLPMEGLRLAYSLDVASRRSDSGFLSYIYGLTSRQQVGEIIFEVMQKERDVFLTLCERVERDRHEVKLAAAAAEQVLAVGQSVSQQDRSPRVTSPTDSKVKASVHGLEGSVGDSHGNPSSLLGVIPLVQLARILSAMYPAYSVAMIEQLVLAASEDGTECTESPVMVYYTLLLPERLLPSPSARSAEASIFWYEGHFAALFYKSIGDDALEAFQMVEDSVCSFGRTREATNRLQEESGSMGLSATAKQLCSFAFKGIPKGEARLWEPALHFVVNTWPLLQVPGTEVLETPGGMDTRQNSTFGARVAVASVVPYLRRHLVLRRGCHATLPCTGTAVEATKREDNSSLELPPAWSTAHTEYLDALQERFSQYSEGEVLHDDVTYFVDHLRRVDPMRQRCWASVEVAQGNPLLRTRQHIPLPSGSEEECQSDRLTVQPTTFVACPQGVVASPTQPPRPASGREEAATIAQPRPPSSDAPVAEEGRGRRVRLSLEAEDLTAC